MAHTERVVVLVDMDCFYCQVEEKLDPSLQGKPIAVVQYNAWRGGGIIAVNYPARDQGVTRHMRGDEAKQKCPDIILARVPQVRGKADLTKYRNAGKEVAEVLQTFTNLLERASVDEAYLDITEEVKKRLEQGLDQIKIEKLANTFVVGSDIQNFINTLSEYSDLSESNIKLAIGGIITEEIRAEILKKTGYKCSAGIAHNKILAKLVCGLHKPNKQTLLPQNAVAELYKDLPIKKIKSLGGKFGIALAEELQITYMGELVKFSEKELAKKFDEKNAKWLYNIARGIDLEPVTVRLVSKSIGCCKKFPGRTALTTEQDVEHWISELATEISERLEKDLEENNRRAKQMVVSFTQETNKKDVSSSRTHPLQSYEQAKIARSALDVIRRFCLRADGSYCITFLGISVGNFQDLKNSVDISSIFKNMNQKESPKSKQISDEEKSKNIMSFFQNMGEKSEEVNLNNALEKNDCSKVISNQKNKTPKSFFQSWASRCQDQSPSSIHSSKTVPEVSGGEELFRSDIAEPPLEQVTTTDQIGLQQNEIPSCSTVNLEKINTHMPSNQRNVTINSTESTGSENSKQEPNQIIAKSFFLNYFMTEGRHLLKPNTNLMKYAKSLDPTLEFPEDVPQAGPSRVETKSAYIEPVPDIDMEICPECNKTIPSSEYMSHLDYHFALKMANDESHLYKEPIADINKDDKNKRIGKISKGESKEPGRIMMLLQKSKKDNCDDSNSEICAECNQRVKISDFGKHFDKHEMDKLSERIVDKPQHLANNSKMDLGEPSSDDEFIPKYKNGNNTMVPSVGPSRVETKSAYIEPVPDIDVEICPECNKKIPSSEYISHLNYHFTLEMANDQSHLYQEPIEDIKKDNKNKRIGKTSNGESKELGRIMILLQKSKKDNCDDSNSEICVECNQRVKISDFEKHFDKHEMDKSSERIVEKPQHLAENNKMDLEEQSSDDEFIRKHKHGNNTATLNDTEVTTIEVPSTSKMMDEDNDLFSDNSPGDNEDYFLTNVNKDGSENNSVYSADTEDLNEDIGNLIFFEDVFSESDAVQPLFSSQNKKMVVKEKQFVKDAFMDLDLNHQLIEPDDNKRKPTFPKEETKASTKNASASFFVNHIKKKAEEDGESKDSKRILANSVLADSSILRKNLEDDKEDCPECNRRISSSELVSHMDYHFALKMVKEEAHLYKKSTVPTITGEGNPLKNSNKKVKPIQTSKRKLPDTKKIDAFLQKTSDTILDESNSELCKDCNKRIKLDETVGHADYHTAKKLHSELNTSKMVTKTLVKAKNKKNKSVMNMKSISNFFKT